VAAWWQEAVVYQIYPRSFQDTTGDGVGDLPGILSRVDYLSETLGVDAVWLSPFYPSPMEDFGYDVSDYCNVHPMFGTLDDFDRLIDALHARGMRLIVDFVPNHSSDQHPWFLASRSSRDDPKRDWYVWRDGRPDGSPPSNWRAVFGGPAWDFDEVTGQWYLHSFLPQQPDLDWRNPEVEAAMHDALRFWLDRGVDGFRIDVAHFIMKDPEFRDNPLAPALSGEAPFKDMGAYDDQAHVHDKGHPDVLGAFRGIRSVLDEYDDRFSVGEIHEFDPLRWAAYYDQGAGLHMPFNFFLIATPWTADGVRSRVDAVDGAVPSHAWPNHVLGNHDEQRLASRFGPESARAAAVLLLTLRGTPTLYYGDELGMGEVAVPPEQEQDPWGIRVPGMSRDGCRTPMAWDASPNAGFSSTGAATWLPLHDDWRESNVEAELADPASVLNLYRTLLKMRKESAALRLGTYVPLDGVPDGCFAYVRKIDGESVAVLISFSEHEMDVPLHPGTVLVSSGMDRMGEAVGGSVRLRAREALVIS